MESQKKKKSVLVYLRNSVGSTKTDDGYKGSFSIPQTMLESLKQMTDINAVLVYLKQCWKH
jgi:hypothetical protein